MSFVVSSLQEPHFCISAPTPRACKTLLVANTESHSESKEHLCNFRILTVPAISSRLNTENLPTLFMELQDWEKPVFISCSTAVIKHLDKNNLRGKDPFRLTICGHCSARRENECRSSWKRPVTLHPSTGRKQDDGRHTHLTFSFLSSPGPIPEK